jgi:hypothetical protein
MQPTAANDSRASITRRRCGPALASSRVTALNQAGSSVVPYLVPSVVVIVVLADLALRMSVTRLALACFAAVLLWVAAAATIAVRSASTRLAAPVSVLKVTARFDGGFSV